jgi:hypothetical protein
VKRLRGREEGEPQLRNRNQSSNKLLALDAMGVIFSEADDGPNLLYPFIVEKGVCSEIPKMIL